MSADVDPEGETANKDKRLQVRMHPRLKKWFGTHCRGKGGMSRVVHLHVETLYLRAKGTPWSPYDDNSDNSDTDSDDTSRPPDGDDRTPEADPSGAA